MKIHEIRVNSNTGEVALFAPSGHPVDPYPWLVIQPGRSADEGTLGVSFGWDWDEDAGVKDWQRLDLSDLPPIHRLADLLPPTDSTPKG